MRHREPREAGLASLYGIEDKLRFMSTKELESVVSQLPAQQPECFSRRFEELLVDQWKRKIEADILAGRLDSVGLRAEEDFEAGPSEQLRP